MFAGHPVFKIMMELIPIFLIWLALVLACAMRVACRRRTGDGQAGASWAAGDPFFYPFGEMPLVPRERHLIAGDFRAWRVPDKRHSPPSAGVALRRNEGGGRPVCTSGTVVALSWFRRTR